MPKITFVAIQRYLKQLRTTKCVTLHLVIITRTGAVSVDKLYLLRAQLGFLQRALYALVEPFARTRGGRYMGGIIDRGTA